MGQGFWKETESSEDMAKCLNSMRALVLILRRRIFACEVLVPCLYTSFFCVVRIGREDTICVHRHIRASSTMSFICNRTVLNALACGLGCAHGPVQYAARRALHLYTMHRVFYLQSGLVHGFVSCETRTHPTL